MKLIRTFAAVSIDENLKKKISEVQSRVKELTAGVKWVPPENLHVTLKFLGNVRENELAGVFSAVEKAAGEFSPFEVSISGLGTFPRPERARVVWVGIEDGGRLADLAEAVDARLAEIGFERENRPFKSHITIGRVRSGRPPDGLVKGIEEVDADSLGTQRVDSVVVMQSELLRDGPVYSAMSISRLSRPKQAGQASEGRSSNGQG